MMIATRIIIGRNTKMSERLTNTRSSVPSQPPGSVTGADSVDGEANRLAGQAMSVHEGKKPASVRAKVSGLISQARSAYNRFTANFSGKKPTASSELPSAQQRQGPRFSDFYSSDGSISESSTVKWTKLLFEDSETSEDSDTAGAGNNDDAAQRGTGGSAKPALEIRSKLLQQFDPPAAETPVTDETAEVTSDHAGAADATQRRTDGAPRLNMATLLRMQEQASEHPSLSSEAQGDTEPVQLEQDGSAKPPLEIRSKLLQQFDPPAAETPVTDGTVQVRSDDAAAAAERRRDSMELDAFLYADANDESEQFWDKAHAGEEYDLKKYWGDQEDDGSEV
ncbi:hypothetical protein [Yoonia sp. BS5-3]|uniref:BSD domain-containing protein n=1 Tax=Yoonia phaeophyticola TaxID=3137369 RepID=A0ABZ2V1W8_9RHOB